jgi:hypothetical protein
MSASLFWFNDKQWAKIVPLIPMNRLPQEVPEEVPGLPERTASIGSGCAG